MASLKRIGFFWGEEKITIVEFDKNTPIQVVVSPLGSKTNVASPFSSNLTEEIQITAILQKILQDNKITSGSFYVSLPMKEIILRSFVIPFVKPDEMYNIIKFESKKYMPFDIQDLSFVYHTIPFTEAANKRLQVIFFAVRKEVLARYERIFKQVNAEVTYCEPYMVSLSKSLLYQKEIKPLDHLAFLVLDKNIGRICFIDKGIPQFIREFPMKVTSLSAETEESIETLNSKIVNEVGNSFDFYARQFNGERIEQMFVASEFIQKDLLASLETELKVTIKKYSPVVTAGTAGQSNDMEAIYAMGACILPPMESLSDFNFIVSKEKEPKRGNDVISLLAPYKGIVFLFLMSVIILGGAFFYFQMQLKITQKQYDQLSAQQGAYLNKTTDSIKTDTQQNIDLLAQFKNIRMRSDISYIILRIASHLPRGAMLTNFGINYDNADANNVHLSIDMTGSLFKEDPNEQIAAVDQIYSEIKSDKELSRFIKNVDLGSLNRGNINGHQVTTFTIQCS